MIRLWAGRSKVRILPEDRDFSLLFNGYQGYFPRVKWPRPEADQSPSSRNKTEWSYTPTPLSTLMFWRGTAFSRQIKPRLLGVFLVLDSDFTVPPGKSHNSTKFSYFTTNTYIFPYNHHQQLQNCSPWLALASLFFLVWYYVTNALDKSIIKYMK